MKPIDTKTWKEFKVGDLFDSQTGDTDLKKPHLNGKGHAVITSGLNNMGVFGYSDEPAKIIKKNTITVDMFGYAIFRPFDYKMVTHARVFSLEPKGFELTEMTGLYMSTIFKPLSTLFNYNNMCSYNKIKHLTVKLPIQPTIDPDKTYHPEGYVPDWNYMEAFMEQINQQAQARLNEYKEGKLEYTTLDSKIGYTPVDTKSWAEFKVGDLFDVRPTKAYKLNRHDLIDNGPNPVLANSSHNNGISGYTTLECTEKGGFISFSDTTSGGDTMFYQPVPVVGYSHVQGMFPIDVELNEYKAQYLISVIRAHLGGTWNYINKLTRKHMKKLKIQLPIDSTGQPDWNYMESFMKQINQQAQAKLNQLEKGNI